MRVRINLEILDDHYNAVEVIAPVDCLFYQSITAQTVSDAQKLVAEALERHTRGHPAFDGVKHWDGEGYSRRSGV